MTIDFQNIPQGILVPVTWFEIKAAGAPFVNESRMLLIGERDGGTADYFTPYILGAAGSQSVEKLFGRGSMVAAMYRHAKKVNPTGEIWGICGNAAGAKASGTLTFAEPNGKLGTCSIRVGENLIQVTVGKNATAASIANLMRRKITGNGYAPCNATAATDPTVIDINCRWRGESGNHIKVDNRWWGRDADLGNLITIDQPSGGSGGSTMDDILAGLGDNPFDVIVTGIRDDTSLASLGEFLDASAGRWSPSNQLFGHTVAGVSGSLGTLVTMGGNYNDPSLTILGFPQSLTPEWCWAAEVGATMQLHFGAPPEVSRPLQGLVLPGIEPAYKNDHWFTQSERQSLYEAGIASVSVDQYRAVHMERELTTYKTNDQGDLDPTWRDANTRFQIMYFVRYMRNLISNTFQRCALTDDDTGINGFASPGQIKDALIHGYIALQKLGLVENADLFAAGLVVERDATDVNRVNILMRPDVVNQLRVIAALVETNLQLSDDQFTLAPS